MIDFHCHLDLYPNPVREVAAAVTARIYVLSVTTTPKAWERTASLAAGAKRIRTALGLHPQLAHERADELPLFEHLLPRARYVGEIGLDGSAEYRRHAKVQRLVFERILSLCDSSGGRILTIHSRGAADEVLECLAAKPGAGSPILHWFTGTAAQLRGANELGCWYSVGPAMLRSAKGRSLIEAMPRNRIITETDGPFAKQDGRPLRPADAWSAVEELSSLWGVSREDAAETLMTNLKKLVGSVPSLAA